MASFIYCKALEHLTNALIDFDTDTIKVSLHTSSYTPNQDTHDYYNDVSNEVTSSGYTAGGATLASKTVTLDTANNRVDYDAADVIWNAVTFTARYAVLYKSTGTAATSPLIACIDFGGDKSPAAEDFVLIWATAGLLRLAL